MPVCFDEVTQIITIPIVLIIPVKRIDKPITFAVRCVGPKNIFLKKVFYCISYFKKRERKITYKYVGLVLEFCTELFVCLSSV